MRLMLRAFIQGDVTIEGESKTYPSFKEKEIALLG